MPSACLVPCVGLVAASGLNWSGDQGCSGENGTVVVNLGAVCGAEASQKGFFVPNPVCLPFLCVVQAAIAPVHSHSLLVALVKVGFLSKFGSWGKRSEGRMECTERT